MIQFSLAQLKSRFQQGASALFGSSSPAATTGDPSYARPAAPTAGAVYGADGLNLSWQSSLDTIRRDAQWLMNKLEAPFQGASAGSAFALPNLADVLKSFDLPPLPGVAPSPAPQPAPTPAPSPAPAPAPSYTVRPGDTLSGIAGRVLGNGGRWREIFDLNRDQLSNPNVIQTGQVLKLPGGANAPAAAPAAPAAPAVAPSGAHGDAPYINQYRPNGSQNGYYNGPSNCGPTSMAMVARAFGYGQGLSDGQLINKLGGFGGTTSAGTSINGIVAMASAIGKHGEAHGPGPDTNWIANQLRAGKLVVANGDFFALDPHHGNVGSAGHYIMVVGVDGNGNFIINDPADSAINHKTYRPDQLARFIHGNSNGGYQIAVG